ncbi:MAG: hypothetical protein IPO40_23475 [Fibrobacteres bacterium]|nr:hypothetical protein [Fibrobacterota bacterium]
MEHTQKYLEKSKHKGYIKQQISNLSDSQKNELENLVIRLENAGAKDPLIWACSEVTESIPQFGRFLVLKSLLEISKSTENNISLAGDFDEDFEEKSKELEEKIGRDKLFDIFNVVLKRNHLQRN